MNIQDLHRRAFLHELGLGFGGLALADLLQQDVQAGPQTQHGTPHSTPRVKSVIWLFMIGGVSHLESFDPKPALNRYANQSINETPYKEVLSSPYLETTRVVFDPANSNHMQTKILPLQVGFKKHGESGLEISDWFPEIASCADDLCLVRSMWTEDNDHGAQLQFHTGRHRLDGFFPTIGSWVSYGLGSLNANLPRFVVLGKPVADCCGGMEVHRANYLGPQYDGVPFATDPRNPLPYARPATGVYREEQAEEFRLLGRLNRLRAEEFPYDEELRARIEAYELAFRMQMAVPNVVRIDDETEATQQLYGIDRPESREFGHQLLTARRLVERGVRFVQVYHGGDVGAGHWDGHMKIKSRYEPLVRQTDRPIAALVRDLKQRGLLDETLVVWATEFGRTPGSQFGDGRDHHPYGFTIWMAGGGIRPGIAHGCTDELGFHAVEHRHYVTDLHATLLHQLGLDPRRMVIPGRKRLERDFGHPIHEILA